MLKKGLLGGFILFLSCFFVTNVSAAIETENLMEACEAEELTCDFESQEPSDDLPNIYIFRGDGCGYCQRLLTFLSTIAEEYQDKVNFVVYEVSNNADNWDFYEQVGAKFGDTITGYPYMVIGTEVFNGYSSADNDSITVAIDELIASENPYDVRSEVEAGNLDQVEVDEESNVGIVVAFIFGVVVVLLLFMGYSMNKKTPVKD